MSVHLIVACCRHVLRRCRIFRIMRLHKALITAKYIGPTRISPVGPGVFGLLKTMYLAV